MEDNKLREQKKLKWYWKIKCRTQASWCHYIDLFFNLLYFHCHSNLPMLQESALVVFGWGGYPPCSNACVSSGICDDLAVPSSIWHHHALSLKNNTVDGQISLSSSTSEYSALIAALPSLQLLSLPVSFYLYPRLLLRGQSSQITPLALCHYPYLSISFRVFLRFSSGIGLAFSNSSQ